MIKDLLIKNFRNIENINLLNISKIVFIIGDNGSGKTNIVESIGLLSLLKSFRNEGDKSLVRWRSEGYYIKAKTEIEEIFEIGCFEKNEILC